VIVVYEDFGEVVSGGVFRHFEDFLFCYFVIEIIVHIYSCKNTMAHGFKIN